MKKGSLYFISGFLAAGLLLQVTPGVAAEIKKAVEANLNTANVEVNGQKVDADNLEYNGSLYLPLRKVAENLGKDVSWDSETNTAKIKDKAQTPPANNVPSGAAKLDSFQISSDSLTILDNSTGEISFKMLDQYGKEYISKEALSNLLCTTTYGKISVDVETSKIIIKDDSGKLKSQKSISITILDKLSGKIIVKLLNIDGSAK